MQWVLCLYLGKARILTRYRKIPKIIPGAYILQRPFWRGLSTEGNLRFQIDWASLIVGSKFTVFALFYFVFEGSFPSTSSLLEGLIFGILWYAGSTLSLGNGLNCPRLPPNTTRIPCTRSPCEPSSFSRFLIRQRIHVGKKILLF